MFQCSLEIKSTHTHTHPKWVWGTVFGELHPLPTLVERKAIECNYTDPLKVSMGGARWMLWQSEETGFIRTTRSLKQWLPTKKKKESEMKESELIQTREPAEPSQQTTDFVCAAGWNNNIWYPRHTHCTLTIVPLRSYNNTREMDATATQKTECHSKHIKFSKLGLFCFH